MSEIIIATVLSKEFNSSLECFEALSLRRSQHNAGTSATYGVPAAMEVSNDSYIVHKVEFYHSGLLFSDSGHVTRKSDLQSSMVHDSPLTLHTW